MIRECLFGALLSLCCAGTAAAANMVDIGLRADHVEATVSGEFVPGSHVKLYIPYLPYLAISHAVNAALLRPAENARGWQYDLATGHSSVDDRIWEFELRRDAVFQDGTPFNADAVLANMTHWQQQPFTFSKLPTLLERVEKLDDYRVRFVLSEPYGAFPHDAMWLQFYTHSYLEKFGWNGKPTCPNLAEPGLYGLGPYVLEEGYVEGDRASPVVKLRANPVYWGDTKPKVEQFTIITDLKLAEARDQVIGGEGLLDVTPLAFGDQLQTVNSAFSKLVVSPSQNNYALHFNLLSGHPALSDPRVRRALNQAIDQEYLLNLSMLGEGELSPTTVSPRFFRLDEVIASAAGRFNRPRDDLDPTQRVELLQQDIADAMAMLTPTDDQEDGAPLTLSLIAQESFSFLTKDIQHFLSEIGVALDIKVMASEKEVFEQLLATWQGENTEPWDLLLWGNYDWYKHPYSAFFVYRPGTAWSTLAPDPRLINLTDRIVRESPDSQAYFESVKALMTYVHDQDYMMFLPTPNAVYAVNKEVSFDPGKSAFIYLRDLEVTPHHWSVRGAQPYPPHLRDPVAITRAAEGEAQ